MQGQKLLIIGNDPLVIQALTDVCKSFGYFCEIKSCLHEESVVAFRTQNPSHVIINEYDENADGADTWSKFLEECFIDSSQTVVLSGYHGDRMPCSPNFIKLPFEPFQLRRVLVGN